VVLSNRPYSSTRKAKGSATRPSGNDSLSILASITGGELSVLDENTANSQVTFTQVLLGPTGLDISSQAGAAQEEYSWAGNPFGISSSGATAAFAGPSEMFAATNWIMPYGDPSGIYLAIDQPVFPPLPSCPGAQNPCAQEAVGAAWNSLKALVKGSCSACNTYVFNILGGTGANFYTYLNLDSPNPRFYDGTKSYAHMNTTMCGNILRQLLTNCKYGSQTVKDYMAAQQADAISRTPSETGKGPLTFFDPSAISLSLNSTSNQALIFHESLHGKYGLYDMDLENAFHICTDQGSVQISNYLERHVLGGTVLVCGQ
jgi:hypothetical protein